MRKRALPLLTGLIVAVLMSAATSANAREIINLKSGLRVDVMWASTADFQGAFLWPNNASLSQEFDVVNTTNGHFRLRARHSGKCLTLDWRQGNYNGTRVMQYPCVSGYAPMEWRRGWLSYRPQCNGDICRTVGTQMPVLINRYSGRCMDARNGAGGTPPAQAVIQQWDCMRYADDPYAGNQLFGFDGEGYL